MSEVLLMGDGLLIANACATWAMLGLILVVQRVHYPLFDRYAREGFAETERAHQRRIGPIVAPLMGIELLTSVGLLAWPPAGVAAWQAWAGVGLVGVLWASTALVQIPLHRRLAAGFDAAAHRRLVATNRVRVVAWAARATLVAVMLAGRLAVPTNAIDVR